MRITSGLAIDLCSVILTLEVLHLDVVSFGISFPAVGQQVDYANKPYVMVMPRYDEHDTTADAQTNMFNLLVGRYGVPQLNEHRMGDKFYTFIWRISETDIKNEMYAGTVLEYEAAIRVNGGWK